MRLKISLKWALFIISIAIIDISSIIILFLIFSLPVQDSYAKSVVSASRQTSADLKQAGLGLPVRLKIPKIKINAVIESVALTRDGAMGVPKYSADAGWFSLGPRPGENGSAVMAGHYGRWKNGQGSIFDNLHKLRPGDKLSVTNDKGVIMSFIVRLSRSYDPNADAKDIFISNDGKAHLNLITCGGAWDKVSKSYPKRLVVFTDKE